MPSVSHMEALYFGVASVNSMGISEMSASPVRIVAAILPVVTPRS